MQLLVQNYLDPSRTTEIFFAPKRRIFALPKIVRYRNKSGLQYIARCTWSKLDTEKLMFLTTVNDRNVIPGFDEWLVG